MALGALCGVFVLGQRVKRQNSTIRRSEERFRHLATHDSLTQLPNRASVLNSLEYATQKARKEGSSVCIALIDLDHFKRINDELGHLVGDEVLRESARRLASSIRTTDFIGRYGGEEFLIVFQDMDLENGAARCEIVRRALCDQPIRWHDGELTITCSVGVAAAKITHNPVTTLISVADQAMYAAKTLGRNRVVRAPISMKHEQSRFAVSAS
jgi:diguanylate cyclase (GGDEF)-like protein